MSSSTSYRKSTFLFSCIVGLSTAFFSDVNAQQSSQDSYQSPPQANAQQPKPLENSPVHEAFVTSATEGGVVVQSIALAPPDPINEKQPPQCHADAIWIPGYWAWVEKMENFVWVSGAWRKPPPDHVWIAGFWKKFDQGWCWIRGFWSKTALDKIVFIPDKPNEPRLEEIPAQPGKNFFWMPGNWAYDFARRQYNWLSGKWTELDANWVYVPAYYLWRPEGYIFIPGYWDFIIDARGCAYAAVDIAEKDRGTISYTPTKPLGSEQIIRYCFAYYPDYSITCLHHWYYYPAYWTGCGCVPPWWHWPECWCFSWSDNWWLWWWWTNPGFPNPPWIIIDIASLFPPPPPVIITIIDIFVFPPPIVIIPWGVITPWDLIDLLGGLPIMPIEPPIVIIDFLKNKFPPLDPPLLPTGKPDSKPPKPEIDKLPPGKDHVEPPEKPKTTPPPAPPTDDHTPTPPPIIPPTYIPTPKPPIYNPPPIYTPPVQQTPPVYIPPRQPPVRYPPRWPQGGHQQPPQWQWPQQPQGGHQHNPKWQWPQGGQQHTPKWQWPQGGQQHTPKWQWPQGGSGKSGGHKWPGGKKKDHDDDD